MVREIYFVAEQCGITFDPEGLRSSAIPLYDSLPQGAFPYYPGALSVAPDEEAGQWQHARLAAEAKAKQAAMREQRDIFNEIVQKLQDDELAKSNNAGPLTAQDEEHANPNNVGPLTVQDTRDAVAPLHSRLYTWHLWAALFWWFLELWCIGYRSYDAEYSPRKTFT